MMEFIKNSAFFGAMLSLIAYEIGLILKKKFKMAIFNPLLISIICVIGVLLIFHIDPPAPYKFLRKTLTLQSL